MAKTDGVPLFVEELTRSVIKSAGEDGAVPATLKDSLMARLDRLGEARDIAQIAAVIGRQFSLSLLAAVAGRNPERLEAMLAKLVTAGIMFPEERSVERGFISSMRWCAMSPMRACCWRAGANGMHAIAHALEQQFRRHRRAESRTCWPIISAKPACWLSPANTACAPAIRQ